MASPSVAEVETQLKNAVDYLEESRKYGSANADNIIGLEDTLIQSLESDFTAEIATALAVMRSTFSDHLAQARALLYPIIRTYGKAIDAPETDERALMERIYRYFITNTKTVQTRAFTFGSPAAGGANVGNGTINRLTKDAFNHDIESVFADDKTAECVQDQNTGADKHEEVFQLRGETPGRDLLNVTGSGIVQNVRCQSARDSLLINPSFSLYTGAAATPSAIEGWTVTTSINNLNVDETNYYRAFPGDATSSGAASAALVIETNETISQAISLRATRLDPNVPMYCQIAFNRQVGACDGTLTLHMGASSASVVLAAQAGWNILRIGGLDDNWARQFGEQDMDIKVVLSGRTTGTLLVDDLIFVPYQQFGEGGDWVCPVGGATPFLRYDVFTWSDTATESKIQRWLWRAFNRYLPHSGAPSVTDP
jgi:hypothetical protein